MGPPEDWEDDFRRDRHHEREMAIWAEVAKHYTHFVGGRRLSRKQKRGILGVLLGAMFLGLTAGSHGATGKPFLIDIIESPLASIKLAASRKPSKPTMPR